MPKEQYEVSLPIHASFDFDDSFDGSYPDTGTFAKEVDGGGTEGMLRNKLCKRLLSNRVQ